MVSTQSRLGSVRERSAARLPPPIPKPGYEIFIGLLAVMSVINLVLAYLPGMPEGAQQIARFMDAPLTVVFMFDFLRHLALSHPRRQYLVNERGWIDLLGSLPTIFPILRLFRVARIWRLLRTYRPRDVFRTLRRDRAATALQLVLFLVLVTVEYGGMLVLTFEQYTPGANITTGGDAIWWAFVSITTVGYGDRYPITTGGRMTAVVMLWIGVALIGVLSAYLANSFLRPSAADADAMDPAAASDPSVDPTGTTAELVAMADDLEVRLGALRAAIARLPAVDSERPPT
jgi:voltage-gated potassium channel